MIEKPFFINVISSLASTNLAPLFQSSGDLGFKYSLLPVGGGRVDPWLLATEAMKQNSNFSPMIAVNPALITAEEVSQKLTKLKNNFPNEVALNLVTGAYIAQDDQQDFIQRCHRLKEFYDKLKKLLKNDVKIFFSGNMSSYFVPSSSLYFVKNIKPLDMMPEGVGMNSGLHLGICVRQTDIEAQEAAEKLFPHDRRGSMLFEMALANNETPWNIWLKDYLKKEKEDYSYYLNPLRNSYSPAPYVVGSKERVLSVLQDYQKLNYSFFIIDYHLDDVDYLKEFFSFVDEH